MALLRDRSLSLPKKTQLAKAAGFNPQNFRTTLSTPISLSGIRVGRAFRPPGPALDQSDRGGLM
jgi:hypothetical protein